MTDPMTDPLVPSPLQPLAAATTAATTAAVAALADSYARCAVFADYLSRKAPNTRRRQRDDLALFAAYLTAVGIDPAPDAARLLQDPAAWQGVSWGLVEGFVHWMVAQGYAVGSVNVRLSTVKTYVGLAAKAGTVDPATRALVREVRGFSHSERKHVDTQRARQRRGAKKSAAVRLTKEQADALKAQPDTPQGRRDALLLALLLDHGLRVGEVARLQVGDVDPKAATLTFYRPKVDKVQTHRLTADTLRAFYVWLAAGDCLPQGPLLRASRKGGALTHSGMSARALTARVRTLGEALGCTGLSAHDCRHYWATRAAQMGTDPFRLQEAGGWNSLAMPRRYVATAQIANEGVRL
jgi:integrase